MVLSIHNLFRGNNEKSRMEGLEKIIQNIELTYDFSIDFLPYTTGIYPSLIFLEKAEDLADNSEEILSEAYELFKKESKRNPTDRLPKEYREFRNLIFERGIESFSEGIYHSLALDDTISNRDLKHSEDYIKGLKSLASDLKYDHSEDLSYQDKINDVILDKIKDAAKYNLKRNNLQNVDLCKSQLFKYGKMFNVSDKQIMNHIKQIYR